MKWNEIQPGEELQIKRKNEALIEFIKKNCSDFINISKQCNDGRQFLYRGIKMQKKSVFIGYSRDRESVGGPAYTKIAKNADDLMRIAGFTALRLNSIFCTSIKWEASSWGQEYVIFPINGFSFGYSTVHSNNFASAYNFPSKIKYINHYLQDLLSNFEFDYFKLSQNKITNEKLKNEILKTGYELLSDNTNVEIALYLYSLIKANRNNNWPAWVWRYAPKMVDNVRDNSKQQKNILETAREFVKANKLYNTNLEDAMNMGKDLWIHGKFLAIKLEKFEKIKNLIERSFLEN